MARLSHISKKTADAPSHLQLVPDNAFDGPGDFNDIFDQFVRYVHAVALRLLGDETDVEDITQEVFWACYKHIDKLQNTTHVRRWLMRVTVQKTRRLLKKRKLAQFMHLSLSPAVEPPMPSATAEEKAAVVYLFSILERMPVNRRLAWSLRYLEGAELKEVAASLNCSLATAKRWIAAAQHDITGGGEND